MNKEFKKNMMYKHNENFIKKASMSLVFFIVGLTIYTIYIVLSGISNYMYNSIKEYQDELKNNPYITVTRKIFKEHIISLNIGKDKVGNIKAGGVGLQDDGIGGFLIGKQTYTDRLYYVFYKKVNFKGGTGFELEKIPADKTVIIEKNDITPQLLELTHCSHIRKNDQYMCGYEDIYGARYFYTKKYLLYVPKGTIIKEYKVNP